MSLENGSNDSEDDKKRKEYFESMKVGPEPPPPPRTKKHGLKLKDEQELKDLHEKLGIESKEGEELEKLVKEFKEGLEKGRVAYKISTKIPKGENYREYTENNQGVEQYYPYSVGKEGNNAVKPFNGVRTDGWDWEKYGDVLVVLAPIKKHQKGMETITEEKKGFFGGTKKIQTQKEVTKNVPVTLADCGIKNGPNEALYSLDINYMVDQSKFVEKRRISNMITFSMPEKLARSISGEVTKNPKKLFEFLMSIESKLIELAPPRENPENPNQPVGLAFYELKDDRANYHTIKPTAIIPR